MNERVQISESGYHPRIVDAQVERYLRLFGAVDIAGTKWCGKTRTALEHGNSVTYVDRGANLEIATADPAYALTGEPPHVIDEWQRVPAIWDTVRHAVDDAAGRKGLWLLTGSSTPLRPDAVRHSGAGRIGRIQMHPMTLFESGDSSGVVTLEALFSGELPGGQCANGIVGLADLCCRGGWPGGMAASPEDAQVVVREYLRLVFEEGVPRFGGDPMRCRRAALSLARNLGQSPTNKTISRDIFALESAEDVTDAQAREASDLVGILRKLYMVDEVPGWVPPSRSPERMRTKPKLYFADPSLAVGLLGLGSASLLRDWQTFGLVFENLVMRDLQVYASALPGIGSTPVRYYRDDSGLEADAIIERADGSWGAIEIKLSQDKLDTAAAHLIRIREKLTKNQKSRASDPSFLAVVTGVGEAPYRRTDGVAVVPVRCLGV